MAVPSALFGPADPALCGAALHALVAAAKHRVRWRWSCSASGANGHCQQDSLDPSANLQPMRSDQRLPPLGAPRPAGHGMSRRVPSIGEDPEVTANRFADRARLVASAKSHARSRSGSHKLAGTPQFSHSMVVSGRTWAVMVGLGAVSVMAVLVSLMLLAAAAGPPLPPLTSSPHSRHVGRVAAANSTAAGAGPGSGSEAAAASSAQAPRVVVVVVAPSAGSAARAVAVAQLARGGGVRPVVVLPAGAAPGADPPAAAAGVLVVSGTVAVCSDDEKACLDARLDDAARVAAAAAGAVPGMAVVTLAPGEAVDGPSVARAAEGGAGAVLLVRAVWSRRWRRSAALSHAAVALTALANLGSCPPSAARALMADADGASGSRILLCGGATAERLALPVAGAAVEAGFDAAHAAASLPALRGLSRPAAILAAHRAAELGIDLPGCGALPGPLRLSSCPSLAPIDPSSLGPAETAALDAIAGRSEPLAAPAEPDQPSLRGSPSAPGAGCSDLAARLAPSARHVAIAVLTTRASWRMALEAERVWGGRARGLGMTVLYVSDEPDESSDALPSLVVCPGCGADPPGLLRRSRAAFGALVSVTSARWLFRTTDDVLVDPTNLLLHLSSLEHTRPVALGDPVFFARASDGQPSPPLHRPYPFHHPFMAVQAFPSGGVGWVLSRAAADLAATSLHRLDALEATGEGRDDVLWGMFLADVGVTMPPSSCLSQLALRPVLAAAGLPDCPAGATVPGSAPSVTQPFPPRYRPCALNAALYRGRRAAVRAAVDAVCGDFSTFCSDGAQLDMCSSSAVEFK